MKLYLASTSKTRKYSLDKVLDLYKNKTITFCEEAKVYFDQLSEEEINWYIENEEYILKWADYSLAGKTVIYISKIEEDYYNVLGMPIFRLYKELTKLGYKITDFE